MGACRAYFILQGLMFMNSLLNYANLNSNHAPAIDGVLSGKYKPLDFRFFVGHTSYSKGQLQDAVTKGKYQPIACSRPLVLKQCIQLPKPLWHEGKKRLGLVCL